MILTLPFPPAALSPNARSHWGAKSRWFAKYKNDCFLLTLVALGKTRKPFADTGDINVKITWHAKGKRYAPDQDNAIASLKAALDGIALALGVDDKRFRLTWELGHPVKGGKVVMALEGPKPILQAVFYD